VCGIIGANNPEFDVRTGLRRMRRGSDETRFMNVGPATFGFQRHAIVAPNVELTQPYRSDGQLTLANGELFDFESIRAQLKSPPAAGCTDIEILHRWLVERGVRAVSGLNMMLAGVVYKEAEQQLFLFRDWVGEEPLHYYYEEATGAWCFGSTIASVLAATKVPIERVKEVPPGVIIKLSPWGESQETYFDITSAPTTYDPRMSYADVTAQVRALLEKSARSRIWTDVPIAALVSGGIDSLITIHLLLKYGNVPQKLPVYTFHCDRFPVREGTDLYHARKVVEFFGDRVVHRVVTVSEDEIARAVPDVVYALEDVRGRDFNVYTAIYNRFLAEAISADGTKIVYEGEGADEALGTYSAWRSWSFTDEEIGNPEMRRKMVSNLHKGVLPRTSKVMMNFGPLECRTFFLDRELQTFLTSLPIEVVRTKDRRKGVLVDSFADELPRALLERPKARPQDATGITGVLATIPAEQVDFRSMFLEYTARVRSKTFFSWRAPYSGSPAVG